MPDATDDGWGPERRVASRSAAAPPGQRSVPAPPLRSTVPPPIRVAPGQPVPRSASAPRHGGPPPPPNARPQPSAAPVAPGPGAAARGGVAVRYREAAPSAHSVMGDARQGARRASAEPQRGLVGWVAVALMVAIAGLGGLIDAVGGSTLKGLFAVGLIAGSLAAILLVRRRDMFPVIIAPPLIYFGASAVLLYFRSGGFKDRGVLIDAVSNWLVYGFPAIAGASAVVLIVAGGRLITNK